MVTKSKTRFIIGKYWYTMGVMITGIILVKNEITNNTQAYIGSMPSPQDEKNDAERILDWGTKLSYRQAKGFFPQIKEKKYG